MSESPSDFHTALVALGHYLYHTSPPEIAQNLFPGAHPDYQQEWAERFSKGWGYALSRMSSDTFWRFAKLVESSGSLSYARLLLERWKKEL